MRKTPEKSWKISAEWALGAVPTLMMLPLIGLLFLFGIEDARSETPDNTMLAIAIGAGLYLTVAGWLDRLKVHLLGSAWVQQTDRRRAFAARLLDNLGFLLIASVLLGVVSDSATQAALGILGLWAAYAAVAALVPSLGRVWTRFRDRG